MIEKILVLERDLQRDLELLDGLWRRLETASPTADVTEEQLIAIGYRLHNLYGACENIFRNIAVAFENTLDDRSAWHAQLLHRMRLDLRPLRPAVIDDTAFAKLDELRRFRHLFRAAYGAELDPDRLAFVLHQALDLRDIFTDQIAGFLDFLRTMQATGKGDS